MSEDRRDLVYLITGGCGFLGKHLLRLLLEKEDRITEIRVFDKRIDATLNGAGTGKMRYLLNSLLFLNRLLKKEEEKKATT